MRFALLTVAALLSFAACTKSEPKYRDYSDTGTSVELRKAAGGESIARRQSSAPMLAYSYRYGIEVPAEHLTDLSVTHEKACAAAGPTVCQFMGSQVTTESGDSYREIRLRAEPKWLASFRVRLGRDVAEVGGRVWSSAVEVEDLTRSIVDIEAQLRAKLTLRDRLQDMLASRPGNVSDLVAIERELARVQGEIDSTLSQLDLMRGKVRMSDVTLTYASSQRALAGRMGEPVHLAVAGAINTVGVGLAAMITAAAFLAPWLLLVVPVTWLLLRWRRKRRAQKTVKSDAS